MASNADFVQYITDQCGGAGEIVAKKMFGDYGIYCNGKIFGLICDDRLYVKPTEEGRTLLKSIDLQPPYDGAKDYFYIADVDDPAIGGMVEPAIFAQWLQTRTSIIKYANWNKGAASGEVDIVGVSDIVNQTWCKATKIGKIRVHSVCDLCIYCWLLNTAFRPGLGRRYVGHLLIYP